MASYVASSIQTLFAGFAFAVAGTFMHYIEPNAYAEEYNRHDRALEQLAKQKQAWNEHIVEKANRIKELRQQLSDVNHYINYTNKSLDLLRKI